MVPAVRSLPTSRAFLTRRLHTPLILTQRRWARVHDVRFLATTQLSGNIFERYKDKLDAKAREEGHADVDRLKQAYSAKIQEQRVQDATRELSDKPPPPPSAPPQSVWRSDTQHNQGGTDLSASSKSAAATTTPRWRGGVQTLGDILDLEKSCTLPVAELTAIWRLRHASSPDSLCAVIPAVTYNKMQDQAKLNPNFILPVPHAEQGAEIHFLQWVFDAPSRTSTVLFTQLAEYKARGEFAVPHTTVSHYLDFSDKKGVVLMRGTVASDRGVKLDDARWLVMCLQKFYGGWDIANDQTFEARARERRQLLEWFRHGDERFSVDKLLEEAERMV